MTKRFGFTLAEVLITLGIIGVVAAMTMPTLMNSTQGAQYKAAYKKALSALGQAVTLNVALDDYNFADTTETDITKDYSIGKILSTRMNVVKTVKSGEDIGYTIQTPTAGSGTTTAISKTASNYTLFFNDGIVFSFPANAAGCTQDTVKGNWNKAKCTGYIDVNGQKGPNKVVACNGNTNTTSCKVSNPTDIYPVKFYDQTVLPNSNAARAVLYGK